MGTRIGLLLAAIGAILMPAGSCAAAVIFTYTWNINPGIPEPATWLGMLLGFFSLGYVRRARRSPAVAPYCRT